MNTLLERARTWLILGRVSNLPTVWSNLLTGWFLNRGEYSPATLALLLAGGSFLYTGGMYLNDFCDAAFDARYCVQRPIPAGRISRGGVGFLAALWLGGGFACLASLGAITGCLALLLIALIVLYDFRHKNFSWAPLVMGACRFLLYALGAMAVSAEISDQVVRYVFPAGLGLGLYVAGITYLARGEKRPAKPTRWAVLLLLAPVAVALSIYVTPRSDREFLPVLPLLLASLLQFGWMAWLLVPFWSKRDRSLGRVVSGLLAGIVLVDLLAATLALGPLSFSLLPLFILALLLQRVIPAT
jgi:4-hydroxybenzoate polyprenyltransferase